MNINEAYSFFNKLSLESNNKAEVKIYKRYTEIFNNLNNREFSKEQLKSIEEKIIALKFNTISKNRIKHYKFQLSELNKYLKQEFTLIPKGYYTALGIELGAGFGATFGLLPIFWKLIFGIETEFQRSLGIAFGVIIGTIIGLFVGKFMDYGAEKRNRVLK